MAARFTIGDPIGAGELRTLLRRIFGDRATPRMAAVDLVNNLAKRMPLRLEFEVNRLRGYAFDSGEAGFSHEVLP